MEFGDLSDNPFSIHAAQSGRSKRHAVKSAVKLIVLVAAGLSLTLVVSRYSPRWLVQRYTHDFETLSAEEKRERLIQISDLGPIAIEPMVEAMADKDEEVARTAYELLLENQNSWTVLDSGPLQRSHRTLVDSIRTVAVYLPDDRTGWASTLLQGTIQYSIDRRDEPSRLLYDAANNAMDMLAISDRAGPSILSDSPLRATEPRRLAVRSEPLPVENVEPGQWTDWPPRSSADAAAAALRMSPATITEPGQPEVTQPSQVDNELAESPSVYRSSAARLQPVDPDMPVILHDIDSAPAPRQSSMSIQPAAHLVDSPMGTFDDQSVMHWLGSEHRELRDKARDELVQRGFSEDEIAIATQIVSGNRETRLALIDAIARADHIDPRPWLLMLLRDGSRDVKLRSVSVLATMKDPGINQQLRMHVTEERDPTVAARIRRVLDLR